MFNTESIPISIAPMMGCTDRYYRFFMRFITKYTLLYTEMIHTNAILKGDYKKILDFSNEEKPLALQLGGNNPNDLSECSKIAYNEFNYDEINLNIGCPSDRVQNGNFGACLMDHPDLVSECVYKIKSVVNLPVTIKCRIGIDNKNSYEYLYNFVKKTSQAGCKKFIIHARVAILKGLSPKENRTIPPLKYDYVYQIKKDFPNLKIHINGGIKKIDEIKNHLNYVDGVMIGREAYENPYLFSNIDKYFFDKNSIIKNRKEILEDIKKYLEYLYNNNIPIKYLLLHILGLFNGKEGSKIWRKYLSENMHNKNCNPSIIDNIIKLIPNEILELREKLWKEKKV
ncbi:MAG: tRNA-dihydrouridine(20/20a) synthase [Candidatus Sericytochromatia bacterium]|nr:MAG: tRNA-dihydrouridine(20/20a) synthase [Candidatus Sericytochromatia bacterium]